MILIDWKLINNNTVLIIIILSSAKIYLLIAVEKHKQGHTDVTKKIIAFVVKAVPDSFR